MMRPSPPRPVCTSSKGEALTNSPFPTPHLRRARMLAALFARHLPEATRVIAGALQLPPTVRADYLTAAHATLARTDFCKDVLVPAENLTVYTWPSSVGWSELGTPERFGAWVN
jgi:hypothetical protein